MEYWAKLVEFLGPPNRSTDPGTWDTLESELHVCFPADYKKFIDSYAPVRLNSHLHFTHPTHPEWDLKKWAFATLEAYQGLDWVDLTPSEFESVDPRFGGPDGLVPLVESDRGECVFFQPGEAPRMYVYVGSDDDFYRYDMTFSEWLYRYLRGEDMTGPNSSAFIPGPVRFDALPGAEGSRGAFWFGPHRSE
ncbi:SMI1/KNR4 family protein [Streptomyces sp. NRRL S-1824]|uniref:SMI1/KNR4 family protein n=1 Tax=Streptomyces sp. NRRL S-1824 TaxID=1463889 RepID=UPI0004C52B3F|nr:SMI1/KNR4 family protein [Streptomyces sp. NRRL S-1824]